MLQLTLCALFQHIKRKVSDRLAQGDDAQVVSDGFDAADDWIAESVTPASVVITADILLAGRCIEVGAAVLAPTGKPFNSSNIGGAIATRAIMADLRAGLEQTSGPAPFSNKDRSQFLNALDRELQRLKREGH